MSADPDEPLPGRGNHRLDEDRPKTAETRSERPFMLAEHTRLNQDTVGTAPGTLQDVQLSHVFPLHNDKQRHSSSR